MKFEVIDFIEQIVRQLSGNVPLDEALDKFKKYGDEYFCNETLTKAEETVRSMITVNAGRGKRHSRMSEGCYSTPTRRGASQRLIEKELLTQGVEKEAMLITLYNRWKTH